MTYPLPHTEPALVGLSSAKLETLCRLIEAQVTAGEYPGAQVAVARHGQLVLSRSFGQAKVGQGGMTATDDTLFLLLLEYEGGHGGHDLVPRGRWNAAVRRSDRRACAGFRATPER